MKSLRTFLLLSVAVSAIGLVLVLFVENGNRTTPSGDLHAKSHVEDFPFVFSNEDQTDNEPLDQQISYENVSLYWDRLPSEVQSEAGHVESSNIGPRDYAGAEACKKCHKKNYDKWSGHSHRWMNAIASVDTVKGDFSGEQTISYQGDRAEFRVDNDGLYWMSVESRGRTHVYRIEKTLGSRFFQYYIGRGVNGVAPEGHDYYEEEQVLPFGYWIDRKMWVPIVHVADELPDEHGRWNPLTPPFVLSSGKADLIYAGRCSVCHTTYPFGDSLVRLPEFRSKHMPMHAHLSVEGYTAESHPEFLNKTTNPGGASTTQIQAVIEKYVKLQTPDQAATYGISCEACHLGCKEHADGKRKKPSFLPESGQIALTGLTSELLESRKDVNWVCSRCHVGARPSYASGAATWNSVEYADAVKGPCYPELTCIHCHDPHESIGAKWSKPPDEDDAVCLSCHTQYSDQSTRQLHTHHSPGTSGDRCLNCHMPRINEGLQDAVRTHMITSPTRSDMISAGHPNACNLCHLDKPIAWTVQTLNSWYDAQLDVEHGESNYARPHSPAGTNWLLHANEATRLVAVDAMTKANCTWGLPEVIEILDDEYLLNRQFAQKGIEDMLNVRLIDYGYRFYMTSSERRKPLQRIRDALQSHVQPLPDE